MTSRPLLAGLAALALAGSACFAASVEETIAIDEPMPVPPELVDPAMPDGGGQPGGGGEVQLRDDVENPSPVAWQRTSWTKATMELTVFWTSGVEPCTVTAGIDVSYFEDEVEVTVLEGAPPEAATISCIMMAVEKQYTIVLDEDLAGRRIVDGAAARG